MASYPTSDQVTSELGEKVTDALSRTVAMAKADLLEYRRLRPAWVAAHSERGLAAWIHDRHWLHLAGLLSGISGVTVHDAEPIRDIYVGINYHLRVKRHHWDGSVSTYPTAAALDFMSQPLWQPTLQGLHEHHLLAGYSWDKELRDIIAPVLSMRDGLHKKIIWMIELAPPSDSSSAAPVQFPTSPAPSRPTIDTSRVLTETNEKSEDNLE